MSAFWPNGTTDRKPYRTREFGHRDPGYARGWHTGWDTTNYPRNCSPHDGVVVYVGYDGAYGNTVIVRHDDGTHSRTAHGAPGGFLVKVGDRVVAGQPLMVQGTTGRSTGVHNHQEITLRDGSFVDPEVWIADRIREGSPAGKPSTPIAPGGELTRAEEEEDIVKNWIAIVGTAWYLVVPTGNGKPNAVVLGGDSQDHASRGNELVERQKLKDLAALRRVANVV